MGFGSSRRSVGVIVSTRSKGQVCGKEMNKGTSERKDKISLKQDLIWWYSSIDVRSRSRDVRRAEELA